MSAAASARIHVPPYRNRRSALNMQAYRAPAWLPGGNLQTIWAATRSRPHGPAARARFKRERWATPDGDFIDVDHLLRSAPATGARHLVLFHGLEGSVSSAYAQAFGAIAQARGARLSSPLQPRK